MTILRWVLMGLIHNTLNTSQWPHVHGTMMAYKMWDKLYQLYFVSRHGTSVYFYMWDFDDYLSTTYLGHMLELRPCIIEMNDRTFINVLFMSLPQSSEWRASQNTLYCKGTTLSLNDVITELNAEFNRIVQESGS